ncbi:hypothetical protein BU26DRAFT_558821 [Trematosphaeria pertusa]|uniref:Uncharacterized protein n=1 Tax=Trematosphaeria pertusa TaxID=390896 RepID=A0A6A6J464_9PLEO|nr:uncharacterized protein BU26DRAFT_558821 [Trematosphaeria pertusa]KAF2257436.1 hypothetical protein BU26DRAFT_558821 [Trematosphaeria pertusa]
MRLLNTKTLKFQAFVQKIPEYVILSHTWGDEEVTFGGIDKAYAKDMAGWTKEKGLWEIVCEYSEDNIQE